MKYVYKIIPGVILFMGLAGACKDDDSTSIPGGIAVDKEEITIGPEGGTEQIAVTSYSNWVARSIQTMDFRITGQRFQFGGMPACHRLYLGEHGTHFTNPFRLGRTGSQADYRYPIRLR